MIFTDINGIDTEFEIELLSYDNRILLDKFSCGNSALDDAFRNECLNDFSSVTKLAVNVHTKEVICVYSLNCSAMILTNYGKHYPAPAVEIKYFAVNEKYQNVRAFEQDDGCLSSFILYDLMSKIYDFTDEICGANFILLYSTPVGERFYKRCGFVDFPVDIMRNDSRYLEGCIPLCFKLR